MLFFVYAWYLHLLISRYFYWNSKLAALIAASLQSEPSFKFQTVILVANSSKFIHLFRFILQRKEKKK